jgi:hypothetical protein
MTVYDVCPSGDNLLHINAQPYSPPAVFGSQAPYMGYTFFRHPPNASKSEIGLFTLSERGSIHCLNLGMPTGGDSTLSEDVGQRFDWSNDVKELDLQAKDLRPDFGLLGAQDDTVDIYPTYDGECT